MLAVTSWMLAWSFWPALTLAAHRARRPWAPFPIFGLVVVYALGFAIDHLATPWGAYLVGGVHVVLWVALVLLVAGGRFAPPAAPAEAPDAVTPPTPEQPATTVEPPAPTSVTPPASPTPPDSPAPPAPTPAAPSLALADGFDPRVMGFHTDTFRLEDDLRWMDRMRELKAPVAMILHASRIVEVLARRAAAQVGLDEKTKLQKVLQDLASNNHLPQPTCLLLDTLRDLGNVARHAKRTVDLRDAQRADAIALRGIDWYFCRFSQGPHLPGLFLYDQPLDAVLPPKAASLLRMLAADSIPADGFLQTLENTGEMGVLLEVPYLPAVLVARLLDVGRHSEAQFVLDAARGKFSDDVRLRQLQGLLWSRSRQLEKACQELEAIAETGSAADEETLGILAGVYKRQGLLKDCHENYKRGWEKSERRNAYLGVNAAATALWLAMPNYRMIATDVYYLLEARQRKLAEVGRQLNCWDQLALAEARLLREERDEARDAYRVARERYPAERKAYQLARDQALEDLKALNRMDLADSIVPALPGSG